MSLSRAELQAMDRDELVETVMELSDRVAELEAQPSLDGLEQAAFRRLLHGLAGTDAADDATPTEAADEIVTRIERLEEMDGRLAELERRVTPDPTGKDYADLTRDEKTFKVRAALARDAADSNGAASMKYGDVKSLFENHPSVGHCYTLMQKAANADGYRYDDSDDRENRLLVNLQDVNDDAVFHAVNKAEESEGGSE